jgi:hypothetical protein
MRVSSITMAQLVDKFRHVGRGIAAIADVFACDRVHEAQFGGVQGLPGKAESFEDRAKGFRGAAIGRVSQ